MSTKAQTIILVSFFVAASLVITLLVLNNATGVFENVERLRAIENKIDILTMEITERNKP